MDGAVSGVMRREVSLRGAAGLFQIPYSTLKTPGEYHQKAKCARKGSKD
jgi:hypothetical protein